MVGHCLVCYTDLKYQAVTSCEHDQICGTCHLRLRHLHNERKCPICKTSLETIVVDDASNRKKLSDYPIWGNDLGADFVFREDVNMFFRKDYFEKEILPLFGYTCHKHACEYVGEPATSQKTPIRGLQDHLRTAHRLALCQLCVDHQRDFVARLPRFTPAQLQKHLKEGDGKDSGFQGHPVCEFCRPTRFYDITALHTHLARDHYKCHVCEQQGLANQYFKNYSSLEKHFDRQHFLCSDAQCLAARFVVFANELDLRHHERQVHGGTIAGDTKLQLEFRVRRSNEDAFNQETPSDQDFNFGLDGQAFVPADLPQSNSTGNLAGLHPLHVQRTAELREQAAMLRNAEDNANAEEAFPSLQSAAGNSTGLRVGWTSAGTLNRVGKKKPAGQVTVEDFPSLPATAPKKNTRKLTGSLATTQRQFAAMSTQANQAASWNAGPTPSATGYNNTTNLSSDNFPSLGGGARPMQTYSAANALAQRNNSNHKANLTADNFPSLGGGSGGRKTNNYASANALASRNAPKAPPSWNSTSDFPAPPTAAPFNNPRNILSQPRANTAAAANTLSGVTMSSSISLDEIKTTMGSNLYKKLKGFTKDFASGTLQADGYVDIAATLFEGGYSDIDFWRFLPALIESCPNPDPALRYLENLKRMQNGAANAEAQRAAQAAAPTAPSSSSWSGAPKLAAPSWSAKPASTSSGLRYVVPPKKKNSGPQGWNSGQSSSVLRAKAPPGSVAVAAAAEGPQTGSATKYMAQQQKQSNRAPTAGGKKKQKKKQNNELRALAFGS